MYIGLKDAIPRSENQSMRPIALFVICLLLAASVSIASSPLSRGDGHFWLGMTRAQLDSAITARADTVVSNGTAFVVCRTGDPEVEYVQYSFFTPPHGADLLWRVTVGYRLTASTADFAQARAELTRILGDPQADSWNADDTPPSTFDTQVPETSQRVVWGDGETSVSLGARWTEAHDAKADRMLVTWVDRRLQRLVQARGIKKPAPK